VQSTRNLHAALNHDAAIMMIDTLVLGGWPADGTGSELLTHDPTRPDPGVFDPVVERSENQIYIHLLFTTRVDQTTRQINNRKEKKNLTKLN